LFLLAAHPTPNDQGNEDENNDPEDDPTGPLLGGLAKQSEHERWSARFGISQVPGLEFSQAAIQV
jgi:hypothetical protein